VQGTAHPLAEQVAAAVVAHPHGTLVTWWGETPMMTWFDDLHRNLLLGDFGRYYSELAASWLWVVTLGGVVLWLRRQRGRVRKVRATVLPDLSAKKGVRRTRGWHAATGIWLTVGLLVLSATGLTWSRYAGGNFAAGLDALNSHKPELVTTVDPAGVAGGGHHSSDAAGPATVDLTAVDQAVATARAADLSGPIEVTVPEAGSAWTVTRPAGDRRPAARTRWLAAATRGCHRDRVPVVFAIGWALPLFGASLAGFLVVDLIAGAVRARRRVSKVPAAPAPAG
jgi:uncharacterized iron-regulated membrane protein